MAELAQSAPYDSIRIPFGWQKAFLLATALLAATITLKVASIQYLEILYFVLIFVLLLAFVENGYRGALYRIVFWLAIAYATFCVAAFALAVASLRFTFYLPYELPPLKGPLTITLARVAELVASVSAMLYLAQVFGKDIGKARFTALVYFWTGIASGVYCFLSLPLNFAGVYGIGPLPVGAYTESHRFRGFYNEGGPYGLYVLSILIIGYAIDRLGWLPRVRVRLAMTFMVPIFVLSYSKAGFLGLITIFVVNGLFARSLSQRLIILGSTIAVIVGITQVVNLSAALRAYQTTAAQYERLSHLHPTDPNFVYGRVAGAFIVPRMIAAHPFSGVGWGNYGLLRNAPEYRGAAVFTEFADDPGLGIFGIAAELGLPLLAGLLLVLFLPFFYLRSRNSPPWLSNLALVQPIVHLYGAQLNLTYPWVVTGIALGLGLYGTPPLRFSQQELPLQVS